MNETNSTNYIGKTVGSQGYYGIEKLGKVILMRSYRGCPLIRIETGEEFFVNDDIVIIDEESDMNYQPPHEVCDENKLI